MVDLLYCDLFAIPLREFLFLEKGVELLQVSGVTPEV